MHVRSSPDACSNPLARQIDLICAPQLMSVEVALAAHNGGYSAVRDGRAVTVCDETVGRAGTPGALQALVSSSRRGKPRQTAATCPSTTRVPSASLLSAIAIRDDGGPSL